MKIAIISDIHANLEALKATIKDIEKRNVDKIICLGDIISKGAHPKECIEIIKEKCDVVIRGNCDRHFSTKHKNVDEMTGVERERIIWNQKILNQEEMEYLYNLPFSHEFYMSGSIVRLFHATPEADYKAVVNEDKIETKIKMFYPSEKTISQNMADVIIYGHIHHPYMDKLYNKTLINVGSVGNSFDVIRNPEKDSNVLETTKSYYLIIEGEYGSKEYTSDISFQFVKVPYDIDKELESGSENIEKDIYRLELKEGRYRNMAKVNNCLKELGIDVDNI